jgi:hypothetical protein
MVLSDYSYEEQTRRRLAEAQSKRGSLEAQIHDLEKKNVELIREIEAYETILRIGLRHAGKEEAILDWDKLLAGKTHREKLIIIAQHSKDTIRITSATDLLYTKGFIKSKSRANAYSMVQHELAEMAAKGVFEKVAAGEYRLKLVSKSS